MNKKTKKRKNNKNIKIKRIIPIILLIIACLVGLWINNRRKLKNAKFDITPEIARSMEYAKVAEGEEKTDSKYVNFDAFFLKDLDGDGNADPIRGTCNEVGKEDTLYMELKVINNGYLKDGLITINSSNFNLQTQLVRDSAIAENYISNNTTQIKLNEIQNGSQKLITGIVRSGDYSNYDLTSSAIRNNINNYSKINSITFTGTHVNEDGSTTNINKTINFNVDWYGSATSRIAKTSVRQQVNGFEELVENDNINLDFEMKAVEKENKLILKTNYMEGTIPEFNGYRPTSVEILGDDITYEYNDETREFKAKREAKVDESGAVKSVVDTDYRGSNRYNTYKFSVKYPKEAYESLGTNEIELLIPVKTWYEGYNNPEDEFENPYVSNVSESTVVTRWTKYQGNVYRFDIEVGRNTALPYDRYVISKEKPLRIYNQMSAEEKNDTYTVIWKLNTGTTGTTKVIMKEGKTSEVQNSDLFIKQDGTTESMEELTSNTAISFIGADEILEEDGWIKLYNDDTDELIKEFTKSNWNKDYKYDEPVKHIRIETSSIKENSHLYVNNTKELDDQYITDNYKKDEFDKIEYIRSTLMGTFGENTDKVSNSANYEAPLSVVRLSVNKNKISTQETCENEIITIKTECLEYNEQKWKNGMFLVRMPSEIMDMSINSVSINNSNVHIIGHDLYEEEGNYYIKILTENNNLEDYNITIDCNITPDPRKETTTRSIELYAINEQATDYYNGIADTYDVDGDSNKEETVGKASASISLISPNELLTNQIASNYDKAKNITVAPKVARADKEQRTADVEVNLTNNYSQPVTDILIQGVIPFEGNDYIMGGRDLGSTFSTYMSETGISIPNALKDYVTIYYSTEEKPTKEITDENNKWTLAEKVADWSKIKTYIISLGDYQLQKGESHTFTYKINIPLGVEYNEVSYSEHGIYFSLMTENGKYATSTAASKLGFMIAKQYNLEIVKYQEGSDRLVKGITFSATEKGSDESRIKVTDINGKAVITGLLAEREYILKEIKSTEGYVLNNEEIEIYTYTDEEGKLYITYKNDDGTYSNLAEKYNWMKTATATKEENEDYKIKIELEDEVRPKLKLSKIGNEEGNKLRNVAFNISGKEINKDARTDVNGEINISGLYLNEEYTITETKTRGYYLLNPIKFKVQKNGTNYEAQITEGSVKTKTVTYTDSIPEINLTLENEKIPTYNLQVTKVEEGNSEEEKLLEDARFVLKEDDDNIQRRLITNENGVAELSGLYQYVEGRDITGKYTLKETKSPIGYTNNQEEISFVVKRKENGSLEISIENQETLKTVKEATIDGNTVKLKIQDKPLFKLVKTDKDTGEPLAGVKFVIKELSEDGDEVDYAKDVNGNYVGVLNESNQYEIETDSNGIIRIPLKNGYYRLREINELEGYKKLVNDELFRIDEEEKDDVEVVNVDIDPIKIEEKETTETLELNYIEDLVDLSNNVKNGNNYESTKVILKRDLDFNDSSSYRNANDTTTYGDYNEDQTTESIKTELTSGKGFNPIGNQSQSFQGLFDGQEHWVKNLYISYRTYSGLFGVTKNALIKNINVSGKLETSSYNTGGVIGYGTDTQIFNCNSSVKILSTGDNWKGGIVGNLDGSNTSIISNCTNNEDIFGNGLIGGIVGYCSGNIKITDCTNKGSISGNYQIGGIVGKFGETGSIQIANSTNNGEINGSNNTGGIIGYNGSDGDLVIVNCTNNAMIGRSNRSTISGGILGNKTGNGDVKVANCSNNAEIIGNNYVGGILGYKSGNSGNVQIMDCINNEKITGYYYIGGILGYKTGTSGNLQIMNSINNEKITGDSRIGGILGYTSGENILIQNCDNNNEIQGTIIIAGIVGQCEADYIRVYNCVNNASLNNVTQGAGIISDAKNAEIVSCINNADLYVDNGAGIARRINETAYIDDCVNYGIIHRGTDPHAGIALRVRK